ncbi:MAG TPA: hypothetical protein VK988_10565 [Acidimicrobiales bacterium]|nr:hypothetical protein [Acidimicrobiales bacterium]
MKDQRGTVAVELSLALGLFLVPLALLVITIPTWPERQTVARAAAIEAARSAVLADSLDEGMGNGNAAVAQAARNYGLDPDQFRVAWGGGFGRGQSMTARVTVRMPALVVPGLTAVEAWSWTASHTERVDDYRSLP